MAYNNAIPAPTNLIANSQAQILGNFIAIDSGTTGVGIGFARNHVTMTDGTNGGLHNRVDYYQSVGSPSISGFISSSYPKNVSVTTPASTNTELFYKNVGADTQMTSSALVASSGQAFVPGGLQFRCATGTLTANNQPITFNVQFPTACLGVIITGGNSGSNTGYFSASSKTATGFECLVNLPGSYPINFFYIAVGY